MMPMIEMIEASIGDAAANLIVGVIVLAGFGIALLGLLFFLLAVRAAWRWLTRASWSDVLRSAERKALR